MANVKISNLPVETDINNILGFAGYNAGGTCKISGADLINTLPSLNLQQVLNSDNTADSNGNTGTIVLTNSANNRTATYGNENISTTTSSFGIDVNGSNNGINIDSDDGTVRLGTSGNNFIILDGRINAKGQSNQLDPGSGLTSTWSLLNSNYLLDGYNTTSGTGGNIRINSRGTLTMHTGNLSTSTPGGALSIFARGNTVSLSTIDGTTVGGDVTISSSSSDVIITGGQNLVLTNSGLGTPAVGDVLTASTTGGVAEWTTPSSGGLDFSSLNISSIKADLTQSSQTQYGQAVTVKASAAIDNGAVVIWDYSGTEVQAKMPSGSTPDQHEIIGIAIEDIALGATGKVLVYGYVTAKFIPVAGNVVTNLALDSSATVNGGTTIVSDINNATTFTDEGGTSNSYGNNSALSHTFYNNEGNISMKFVNWDIEQAGSSIFDRLGFTVSNDGTNFANATFTPATDNEIGGFRQSNNAVAPWSATELSGGVPADGYILCESPGGAFPANSVINTGFKYVRAYFTSDGNTFQTGWEIEVYGSQALSNSSVAINEGVFINPNDLSATSGLTNTGRTLGNYISTDVTNNAVVIFVAPARPQQ